MDKFKQLKNEFIRQSTEFFADIETKLAYYYSVEEETDKLKEKSLSLNTLIQELDSKITSLKSEIIKLESDKLSFDKQYNLSYKKYMHLEQEISEMESTFNKNILELQNKIDAKRTELDKINAEVYPILSDISEREKIVSRREKDLHIIEKRWKKKYEKLGINFKL